MLSRIPEMDQWLLVEELMTTDATTKIALGYLEPERLASSYALVEKYFKLDKPFDVKAAYTNEFLRVRFKSL